MRDETHSQAFDAVLARAEEVLENKESAAAWMLTPVRALGGQTPASLLDTEAGHERVMDLLTQIDRGTYS